MNISKVSIFSFIILIVSLLAVVQPVSAQNVHEVHDESKVIVVTLVGPRGEQVAVFCRDDEIAFTARPNGIGGLHFSGAREHTPCDQAMLNSLLPGFREVINTSPIEGWVIFPWDDDDRATAHQCQDGLLIEVSLSAKSEQPEMGSYKAPGVCSTPPSMRP